MKTGQNNPIIGDPKDITFGKVEPEAPLQFVEDISGKSYSVTISAGGRMNQYLVTWSIHPAYGDPEGDMLMSAESPEEAIALVEKQARGITEQGQFHGEARDITRLWPMVLAVLKQKPEEVKLIMRTLKALTRS